MDYFSIDSDDKNSSRQRSFRVNKKADSRRRSDTFVSSNPDLGYQPEYAEPSEQYISGGGSVQTTDVIEGGMLKTAGKKIHERVRDVSEKTVKPCLGKNTALKENMVIANYHYPDPHSQYIYDKGTGTTYLKGRLLGKVRHCNVLIS